MQSFHRQITPQEFNLLSRMLTYGENIPSTSIVAVSFHHQHHSFSDPSKRITASEALQHPFFTEAPQFSKQKYDRSNSFS